MHTATIAAVRLATSTLSALYRLESEYARQPGLDPVDRTKHAYAAQAYRHAIQIVHDALDEHDADLDRPYLTR